MRRGIDEARARELSVQARCDPRTIKKVLRGETVRGDVARRARRALEEAGYLEVTIEGRSEAPITSQPSA